MKCAVSRLRRSLSQVYRDCELVRKYLKTAGGRREVSRQSKPVEAPGTWTQQGFPCVHKTLMHNSQLDALDDPAGTSPQEWQRVREREDVITLWVVYWHNLKHHSRTEGPEGNASCKLCSHLSQKGDHGAVSARQGGMRAL